MRIMLSGLGGLGEAVVEAVEQTDHEFIFDALCYHASQNGRFISDQTFHAHAPESHKDIIQSAKAKGPIIIVDATSPEAIENQIKLYCETQTPFIIGTTGGDRDALKAQINAAGIHAIMAPNMSPQIVALQELYENMNLQHDPNHPLFIHCVESHQEKKADTSGTAKANVPELLRANYASENITPEVARSHIDIVRGRAQSLAFGVPEEYLNGHGWHTYIIRDLSGNNHETIDHITMQTRNLIANHPAFNDYEGNVTVTDVELMQERFSKDRTSLFRITNTPRKEVRISHNINGRAPYGQGTVMAIDYLAKKIEQGAAPRCYSMIDVINNN